MTKSPLSYSSRISLISLFFPLFLKFLVVRDNSSRESKSQGVDLTGVSTSTHSQSDIEFFESIESQQHYGFHDFGPESVWGQQIDGSTVDSQNAFTFFAESNCHRCLFAPMGLDIS